jgi:flagellar hook-basal body complex protein FliE
MNYIPKVQLQSEIGNDKLSTLGGSVRMDAIDGSSETPSFKNILTNMGTELNNTVKAPEQALQNSMTNNSADIHDVIIAMSKAELGVNIATQLTTKVVQAYEKVMSIQI